MALNDFQRHAYAEVGLTAWDAERLGGEHDVSWPFALLDVEERLRLMRAIASAYGRLYLSAPDRFLWMGFAALAVNDGVKPASALASAAARNPWVHAFGLAALAEDAAKAAFEANFAIFSDLYWVHLAYVDGGLRALAGAAPGLRAGFAAIDAGDPEAGNHLLFRHEQWASVTPVFERYHRALEFATRMGMIAVPNARLRELSPRPGWDDARSYGPFAARWSWLQESSWAPFVRLHRDHRAALHAEIWRAVAGDPETTVTSRHAESLAPRLEPDRLHAGRRQAA